MRIHNMELKKINKIMKIKKNNYKSKYYQLIYDPVYFNKIFHLWIQLLIKQGKRTIALKIIYKIINKLEQKTNQNSINIIYQAIFAIEKKLLKIKYKIFPKILINELTIKNKKQLFFIYILTNKINSNNLTIIDKISFKIYQLAKTKINIKQKK